MTHDDLLERIAGQRERLILGDRLFLGSQCVGRLNVGLLAAGGCNEVDFPRNRRELSFGIFLIAIDDGLAEKFTNKPDNISMKKGGTPPYNLTSIIPFFAIAVRHGGLFLFARQIFAHIDGTGNQNDKTLDDIQHIRID